MVVWFRHGPCTVGVEDGLIPAAHFAELSSLLDAAGQIEHAAEQHLARARAEAEALLAAAREQAEALLTEARAQQETALAEGLEQGRQQGLQQWTELAVEQAAMRQRELDKQRDRLGSIVALAVERVVEQCDRQALFQRALRTVAKLVQEVPMLTLRVSLDDQSAARRAVDAVLAGVAGGAAIEVVPDGRLASGSCLFESDQGVIDAGLRAQLAAIQRAAVRAAERAADEQPAAAGDIEGGA